jgi:hypothetical protein
MSPAQATWQIRYTDRFLKLIMNQLAGNAHICFEGQTPILHRLLEIPGASDQETPILKRETAWPLQEFVIVPLETESIQPIFAKLGGSLPRAVIHITIEKDGERAFGAYDRFQPECICFGKAVTNEMLDSLIAQKVLKRISPTP